MVLMMNGDDDGKSGVGEYDSDDDVMIVMMMRMIIS